MLLGVVWASPFYYLLMKLLILSKKKKKRLIAIMVREVVLNLNSEFSLSISFCDADADLSN